MFIDFSQADLMKSFEIMWQGMVGIFFVLIVIALLVAGLTFITRSIEKKKSNQEKN